MNSKKFYELLGLAYISKKLSWGEISCINAIKNGSASLIIIANDIGMATQKKINHFASLYNVSVIKFATKFELGKCIGKKIVSVIVISDLNFARKLKNITEV